MHNRTLAFGMQSMHERTEHGRRHQDIQTTCLSNCSSAGREAGASPATCGSTSLSDACPLLSRCEGPDASEASLISLSEPSLVAQLSLTRPSLVDTVACPSSPPAPLVSVCMSARPAAATPCGVECAAPAGRCQAGAAAARRACDLTRSRRRACASSAACTGARKQAAVSLGHSASRVRQPSGQLFLVCRRLQPHAKVMWPPGLSCRNMLARVFWTHTCWWGLRMHASVLRSLTRARTSARISPSLSPARRLSSAMTAARPGRRGASRRHGSLPAARSTAQCSTARGAPHARRPCCCQRMHNGPGRALAPSPAAGTDGARLRQNSCGAEDEGGHLRSRPGLLP